MNKKEILENNKLIAKFEGGWEYYTPKEFLENAYWKNTTTKHSSIELKYHSSWDWIMPCIEKIEKLGYTMETQRDWEGDYWLAFNTMSGFIGSNHKKEKLFDRHYFAVMEFIKWYNKNKENGK